MKKYRLVTIFLVLILILTACAKAPTTVTEKPTTQETKTLKFAFLAFNMANPSVKAGVGAAQAKAKELGVELQVLDGEGDVQKQSDTALNALSLKVDGIVINPVDAQSFVPIAKQISDAGIPLVAWAQNLGGDGEKYLKSYVGTDEIVVGRVAGETAVKALPNGGNVVIVEGQIGSTPQIERTKGFEEVVGKAGNITILEKQASPWDSAKALSIMEDYLIKYSKIDLIYVHDDNMALGVIEALRNAGLVGKIPVIAVNGSPEAFAKIKAGELYASMYIPFRWGGAQVVSLLNDLAHGKTVDKMYLGEVIPVTKDNVNTMEPAW